MRRIIFAASLLIFCTLTHAQSVAPLADHVPADAVVYAGWAGADSKQQVFQNSNLADFISHSNLPQVAQESLAKLWQALSDQTHQPQKIEELQQVLTLLWHHPFAVYASSFRGDDAGRLHVDHALVCDVGPDGEKLQQLLQALSNGNPRLHVINSNGLVTLTTAPDSAVGRSLVDNEQFKSVMQPLMPSAVAAVYIDVATITHSYDQIFAADADAPEAWPKIRNALGLTSIKTFAYAAGFDQRNWRTASSLMAASPRAGVLSALEPHSIDAALLERIPATADCASVYNFDAARLFDVIGQAMDAQPKTGKLFHQASGLATLALGRNFRQQILASLGPQWISYSDFSLHVIALLNHPTDSDNASDGLTSAIFGLSNLANSQLPGASTRPAINVEQPSIKGVDITTAVTRVVSPSFALKNGIAYFSCSPESVVTAATATKSPTDLLHSPAFLTAVNLLGIQDFTSFSFSNLPTTAPKAYEGFNHLTGQLQKAADAFHLVLPQIQFPPLDQIKADLIPALSVTWADDKGIYCKSLSPFPFSTLLLGDPEEQSTIATAITAAVEVIRPAVEHARRQNMAIQEMNNERQIVLAMLIYAQSHHGDLPPDLGTLVTDGALGARALQMFPKPDSQVAVPAEIIGGTKDQQADWVNQHSEFDYQLAGEKLTTIHNAAQTVALIPHGFENTAGRIPVGFVDGHVENMVADRAKQLLLAAQKQKNP